jgi:dihydroneopterin aldolase
MELAKIELEDMEFYASHGCYDLEQKVGNRFIVNLKMTVEVEEAAYNDDISKTVNYLEVYELVARQMAIPSRILENVALRILEALSATYTDRLKTAEVKVSKLARPLGGPLSRVSVTMSL